MEWHRVYTAIFKDHRDLIFMQKLLDCIRSKGFLGARFTGSTEFEHLSWTYQVFNDLKIIIMGNSYDVLGAFLWNLLIRPEVKGHKRIDRPPQYKPKYR